MTKPKATTGRDIVEFTKRARATLWRQDKGKEKKAYDRWTKLIEMLQTKDGGMLSHHQAVVRASREFGCLALLFKDYDVSRWETANIDSVAAGVAEEQMLCENIEQTYRENIRWAIEAAGAFLRNKHVPRSCPNDSAFFLYRQAIEDPKDFLAKYGQVESKEDKDAQGKLAVMFSARHSIDEIENYLSELEHEEESERNEVQ